MNSQSKNEIRLRPNLENCIETIAGRAYRERLCELVNGNQNDDRVISEIIILEKFLESADFRQLRSEYENFLTGGQKVEFNIYLKNGMVNYNLEIIPPPAKGL